MYQPSDAAFHHARDAALQRRLGAHENSFMDHAIVVVDRESLGRVSTAPLRVFTHLARQGKFQYKNLKQLGTTLLPSTSNPSTHHALVNALFQYACHIAQYAKTPHPKHGLDVLGTARLVGRYVDSIWAENASQSLYWWDQL